MRQRRRLLGSRKKAARRVAATAAPLELRPGSDAPYALGALEAHRRQRASSSGRSRVPPAAPYVLDVSLSDSDQEER